MVAVPSIELPTTTWEPQEGPQLALCATAVEDVLYGGARGGGKTMGLLLDFANRADLYGHHARGILFRRTFAELEEVEYWARQMYLGMGAVWQSGRRTWIWPNGASLRFRYLDRDADADHFQGHSYGWVGFDEGGQWPSPEPLDKLRATLRSAAGVPCVFRLTANPGGVGHNFLKARYIDPAPPWVAHTDEMALPDGSVAHVRRLFIPALLDDNPALAKNDPSYWERVALATGNREDLLKAWRYGLWDIVAGGMFDDLWTPRHIVEPFPIPATWTLSRTFDWGSTKPFSVGWWARSDGNQAPNGQWYPKGTVFRVAEWYGWNGKPNEGLRMLATDIGRTIVQMEREMGWAGRVRAGAADPSIWAAENGVCIGDDLARGGARFIGAQGVNATRIHGWNRLRTYLAAVRQFPMEAPGLFVFATCRQFIRTVPILPRDPRDPDDVDTSAEDHVADETRYYLMTRVAERSSADIRGV